MEDKRITLIVSDLHVGGGPADPGDDHVCHKNQLVNFLHAQAATSEGLAGELELFFNGDFLEFVQTDTAAYSHVSDQYWCTEPASLHKLDTIIAGHPEIFEALARFQDTGSLVTIAAGNHDVDLYWPSVQTRLRAVAGDRVRFEIGKDWVERHGGALQIAHGHAGDTANAFKNWAHPVLPGPEGIECLEMCPGTLFMVKFVNLLEAKYPFADNLLPVTKLAWVLLNDDKAGFMSVGWMFARFVATTSPEVLSVDPNADIGARLLSRFENSKERARELRTVLIEVGMETEAGWTANRLLTLDRLAAIMLALLGRIDMTRWQMLFDVQTSSATLGDDSITLSAVVQANFVDGKARLRAEALRHSACKAVSVVVTGHTHQPDEGVLANGTRYYNPGSWTRYLELDSGTPVRLRDLQDESRYPYQLNWVRVENQGGALLSEMRCFDEG